MSTPSATVSLSSVRGGLTIPTFLYGTAWKEDATERLVRLALVSGFRGIDTANQRKHYFEAAVGRTLVAAYEEGLLTRADLFLQSKFTHLGGQDHRLPYDPSAPLDQQVRQSVESSCEHLCSSDLDSYILHGPSRRDCITDDDWQVWTAMEELCDEDVVRLIGVSNISADQLRTLCAGARISPTFVQNRCYASRGWDAEVRAVCSDFDVLYQGFSLLTANAAVLRGDPVRRIAERHGRTAPQIVFRAALQLGILPLTGTSQTRHMEQDLQVYDFELSAGEARIVEQAGGQRS